MKNILYTIGILILHSHALSTIAQTFDMIVAKEGSGAYRTLSSAIARVQDNMTTRTVIFVKNGLYKEKVVIPPSKINVSIIGESVDSVIINWNDYSGKGTTTTATSYTLWADAANLYIENVTIKNSAGAVGQAVAIRTTGDKQIYKNCKFLGFQDTYYAHSKRQYNVDCYVEGGTDFIFGDATNVFKNSIIHCLNGGSKITAPADSKLTSKAPWGTFIHGLMFENCNITAEKGVAEDSYYLGRPWQPNASSVYLNCTMGSFIRKLGWSVWSPTDNHLSAFFAEYNSKDYDGNLVDISGRATWSKQLTDTIVRDYYNLDSFFYKIADPWNPFPIEEEPFAPQNLKITNNLLTWTKDDTCRGFIIFRNDTLIGICEDKTFEDTTASKKIDNTYYIKSVSTKFGNLSEPSNEVVVKGITNEIKKINDNLNISFYGNQIAVNSTCDIKVFSISGIVVQQAYNVNYLFLGKLKNGVYIVKTTNKIGQTKYLKIVY
jgi:pectin methylesterase-like acyl-CoA thioesterase